MSGNTEGGGNWKACVFCKTVVVEFVIVLDLFRTYWKEKRDSVEGLRCSPGHWGPPHIPPAGAGAALSLLLLRVLHQVPGRLWRGGAHSSAQFPFLSILGKKGQCRFWKGKSRALHRQCLGSPPATSGHRSHPGDTDWDKNKLLGLFRAVVQQLMRHLTAVEGKCNEIQQQRRVGCVWLPPQKTIPPTPLALH